MNHNRVPRVDRLCRLCSAVEAPFLGQRLGGACVEDLKHFVLECPAYGQSRSRYTDVFGAAPTVCSDMRLAIFDRDLQDQVADAVYIMTLFTAISTYLVCKIVWLAIWTPLHFRAVEQDVELLRIS
jgi:hypothetical protein